MRLACYKLQRTPSLKDFDVAAEPKTTRFGPVIPEKEEENMPVRTAGKQPGKLEERPRFKRITRKRFWADRKKSRVRALFGKAGKAANVDRLFCDLLLIYTDALEMGVKLNVDSHELLLSKKQQ